MEPRFNEVPKGLGKLVRYIEDWLYRKPRKQPKCSLYRGVVNNVFFFFVVLRCERDQ